MARPKRKQTSRTGGFGLKPVGGRKRSKTTLKAVGAEEPVVAARKTPEGTRSPTPVEARSRANWMRIDAAHKAQVDALLEAWRDVRAAQTDSLVTQVAAARKLKAIAKIHAPELGTRLLYESMQASAADAIAGALLEAREQGIEVDLELTVLQTAKLFTDLRDRAEALITVMAEGLSDSARRRALGLSGGTLTKKQVAAGVRTHLEALTDRYLQDQFAGAITSAQNSGRISAMQVAEGRAEAATYYISALLDRRTCRKCKQFDGRRYKTLAAIMKQMPAGGNKDCLGGVRCRCVPVAVYAESEPSK